MYSYLIPKLQCFYNFTREATSIRILFKGENLYWNNNEGGIPTKGENLYWNNFKRRKLVLNE